MSRSAGPHAGAGAALQARAFAARSPAGHVQTSERRPLSPNSGRNNIKSHEAHRLAKHLSNGTH
eukprot:7222027-Pyramimonas_sp.AAC.1